VSIRESRGHGYAAGVRMFRSVIEGVILGDTRSKGRAIPYTGAGVARGRSPLGA
jgi:hypothetical protein